MFDCRLLFCTTITQREEICIGHAQTVKGTQPTLDIKVTRALGIPHLEAQGSIYSENAAEIWFADVDVLQQLQCTSGFTSIDQAFRIVRHSRYVCIVQRISQLKLFTPLTLPTNIQIAGAKAIDELYILLINQQTFFIKQNRFVQLAPHAVCISLPNLGDQIERINLGSLLKTKQTAK